MEINFEDYLSEDEREQIVADVFRAKCVKAFEDSGERMLSNASYTIVTKMVDEVFDGKLNDILTTNVIKVINDLSSYAVFKRKDVWEPEESVGCKLLAQAIIEQNGALKQRISDIISTLDEEVIREFLKEEALYLLDTKLFGSNIKKQGEL